MSTAGNEMLFRTFLCWAYGHACLCLVVSPVVYRNLLAYETQGDETVTAWLKDISTKLRAETRSAIDMVPGWIWVAAICLWAFFSPIKFYHHLILVLSHWNEPMRWKWMLK